MRDLDTKMMKGQGGGVGDVSCGVCVLEGVGVLCARERGGLM